MDKLLQDLEKLNFTVNEAKVYLTMIKLGPSHAGNIAKEASLDRSSTYNALKALTQRGIVSTIFENKRSVYLAEPPKKIIDYYKEKEEIAKLITPELEKRFHKRKEKSAVKVFKGFKGLKTVFQDALDNCENGETYYVLGSEGQLSEHMPYYASIIRARKEQKKVQTKTIIRSGRVLKQKGKYTEYKEIPINTVSPITINLYPGKVAIFIWGENPECVLIENEEVKKTLEGYFQFMWKHAKRKL